MLDCKHCSTPMASGPTLSLCDREPFNDPSLYWSIVGTLQYCTLTKPDVYFSVNKVCQFMHAPTPTTWQAMECILQYLKGISSYGLSINTSNDLSLLYYTDANWASCHDDKRTTVGTTALFLVLISSLGHLQDRRLCLTLVLNFNIGDLIMLLLRSLGLNLFCMSYVFVFLIHHFCCVTTLVLHTWLLTLCYMWGQNMSKLTIILFVKELCAQHSEFNTPLLRTN